MGWSKGWGRDSSGWSCSTCGCKGNWWDKQSCRACGVVWWFGQKGKGSSSRAQTPVRSKWEDGPPASILKNTTEAQEQEQESLNTKEVEDIKLKLAGLKPMLESLKEYSTEASKLVEEQVKKLEGRLMELTERPVQDRIRSLLDKKKDREKKVKDGEYTLEKIKDKQKSVQMYLDANVKELQEITQKLKELGVKDAPIGEKVEKDSPGESGKNPLGSPVQEAQDPPLGGKVPKSPADLLTGGGEDKEKEEMPWTEVKRGVSFETRDPKRKGPEEEEDQDMEEGERHALKGKHPRKEE